MRSFVQKSRLEKRLELYEGAQLSPYRSKEGKPVFLNEIMRSLFFIIHNSYQPFLSLQVANLFQKFDQGKNSISQDSNTRGFKRRKNTI